jgi:hypothetical protein
MPPDTAERRPAGGGVPDDDSTSVAEALDVARALAAAGVPVFVAYPDPEGKTESGRRTGFTLPRSWQTTAPNPAYIGAWRPGRALCAVMGYGLDLVDVDPRNGGQLAALDGVMPKVIGEAASPSGGTHLFVASMGTGSRDGVLPGIDIKAGTPGGSDHGYAFIAPTVRPSKVTGEPAAYRWVKPPDLAELEREDASGAKLAALVRQARSSDRAPASALFRQPASTERKHAGPIPYGEHHRQLVSYAGWLRSMGVPLQPEAEMLMLRRLQDCEQPAGAPRPRYTEAEALAELHDVYSRWTGSDPAADNAGVLAPPDDDGELSRLDLLRAALLDSAGLDSLPVPEPLIDGWLFRDSLAWLHGKPGHAKSLVSLDWACCIDAGLPWLDQPVSQGPVLYVIAEGATGLHARVRAWEDRAQMTTGVRFLPVAVQLLNAGDGRAVAELAAELAAALVVIDTQARVTVGAEENSAVDMGRVVVAAEQVRRASRACVLFVHHEARGGENMRGSTALEGAADTVLRVVKDGPRVELTNPKQKDAAEHEPAVLWVVPRLQSVVIAGQPEGPTLDLTSASEIKILNTLLDLFGTTGASATTLREATGLAKSTFHWALNRLVKDGKVVNFGTKTRTCYGPAQAPLPAKVQQVQSGPSPTGPMSNAHDTGVCIGLPDSLDQDRCACPGCSKPPRRHCSTCWEHAQLEPAS